MITFEQFKNTRDFNVINDEDTWCYGLHGNWTITETYTEEDSVFVLCGEEFTTLEEAEKSLYNMYCDEQMLLEGY